MWRIECDGFVLHDDNLETLRLQNMNLELELNKLNSFSFTIYPTHPYYDTLKTLKSIITVKRDGETIFRGRILDKDKEFYNQKQVVCEGELGFLLDSLVEPATHTGTPAEYLQWLINNHNEQMADDPTKQFVLGEVTVAGETKTRNPINYSSTWKEIGDELIAKLGGYILVDTDGVNRRINYITESKFRLASQEIKFGENLLDFKETTKGTEIATAILPIGGSGETVITIESLPDGIVAETDDDTIEKKGNYVFSRKGVETYGFIKRAVTFQDTDSDIEYLQDQAIEELNKVKKSTNSMELNAVDISRLKLNINSFNIGTIVRVTSLRHDLKDTEYPVTKIKLNLLKPASNKLTLQKTYSTFTERSVSSAKSQINAANTIRNVEANVSGFEEKIRAVERAVVQTTEELSSMINQSSEEILTQVSDKHYLKDETNALISNVETQIKQTNSEVEIRFNTFNQSIEDLQNGTDAQFTNISKYIRFKDGNILLGEEGNELILKIQNDRISFLESNTEVAYFSNRKLYVLDGEFINQLRLGNFAFIPRSNGNVSFKKVT